MIICGWWWSFLGGVVIRLCPCVSTGHHIWAVLTGCHHSWAVVVVFVVCEPLFWVVAAEHGGGVVINHSHELVGLVAWRCNIVVVLVGVGCKRLAVQVGVGGSWQQW